MPIYTSYNRETRCYEFTSVGEVSAEEFLTAQTAALADPNFQEATSIRSDLRRATYHFNEHEMALLSANKPEWMEGKQLTYLVTSGQKTGLLWDYLRRMGLAAAAIVLVDGVDAIPVFLGALWTGVASIHQVAQQLVL